MSDLDGQSEVNLGRCDRRRSGSVWRGSSPRRCGGYPRPMCIAGDWVAPAGVVFFAVASSPSPG